ncbi:PAP2 family protein [Anaerofustis stercorihominis DSM 17244]|uniref:PAP2 family protein n=1 Tax=Anaerofustis stercorihominis DSM 17244 TaxID=445971 RepID=B1CBT6_9FIRM|nr:phosphatase PAP2 family protein [Anaerofustis stercorihominis]EDS71733.1 PAP2 family protein [Anaerofustis stercorihominis DSM 17244]
MNKEFYLKLYEPFYKDKNKKSFLNIIDKIVTNLIFISFPIFIIIVFINVHGVIRLILSTLIPFMLLSIFRKVFDAKRPYEIFDIKPILNKDTKGKSFPSRHVFSAFVIGTSGLFIYIPYGTLIIILGVLLAIIRVIGGVHFIKDVSVGALIGILSALIGMLI